MHPFEVMRHFNNVLKLEKKQKAKLHYSEQDEASFKLENKFLQLLWESDTENGLGNQMKMPTSVTFVPQFRIFLVTEMSLNRIGVYEEEHFVFRNWLQFDNSFSPIINPSTILCLGNGFVAILDENNLHILDASMSLCQAIPGSFHGLTEGSSGTILTILQSSAKAFLKVLKIDQDQVYKWTYSTELVVAQEFHEWSVRSKCEYLLMNRNMVYISDIGLKKVYMVDLTTHHQTASRLTFNKPAGLLVDDSDNILISDCCKIFLSDSKLQTFRVLIDGFPFLSELVRHGNLVIAVRSKQSTEATLAKLKITGSVSNENFINSWFEKGLGRSRDKTRSCNANISLIRKHNWLVWPIVCQIDV